MNIPSIPFDNIGKLLLFIGLVLITATVINFFSILDKDYEKSAGITMKRLELQYQGKLDSIDIKSIEKRIARLNIELHKGLDTLKTDLLSENLSRDSVLLFKTKAHKKRDGTHISILNKQSDFLFDVADLIIYIVLLIIGGFLCAAGGILWDKSEETSEERRKNRIETKELPCQSCGMILKYDLNAFVEKEFCSNCFDGKKYNEPELTLGQMQDKIRAQMKGQDKKRIEKHIANLSKLNRWAETLRWQQNG